MNLREILAGISTLIFTEFVPISQFLLLKEPLVTAGTKGPGFIKRIASISEADRAVAMKGFRHFFELLQETAANSSTATSMDYEERVILEESLVALEVLIKDEETGWFPYLSENFLTGVHSESWLYAIIEGKLVAGLGGKSSPKAKAVLLHVLTLTPAFQAGTIENWKKGLERGLVMSQGAVEQTIADLKERYLDSDLYEEDPNYYHAVDGKLRRSLYFKLADGLQEDAAAVAAIANVIQGWHAIVSFLSQEYLVKAKLVRPYATPGINVLPNGTALYKHLIRRFVTYDPGNPETVAALGYRITADIVREMTVLGQRYLKGCQDFSQVASLLLDKSSPLTHLQEMNGERVKAYLEEETRDIKQVLHKEFKTFPRCDFDIRLFKSAGVAYYVSGRVDFDASNNDDGFCVEKGVYYAGVPSLDPNATFAYEKDDLSLLMHESVPGHHFQLQLAIENRKIARDLMGEGLKMFLSGPMSGFTEGWALYAESLGFQLGLYLHHDGDHDGDTKKAMRTIRHHNNNLLRSLRLILDSELNSGKRNRQDAIDLMVAHGFQPSYAAFEVDRYTAAPGQALGYMLGCQRILDLRRRCEQALADKFSPGDFHDVLLSSGTVTLDTVTRNVDRYIIEARVGN